MSDFKVDRVGYYRRRDGGVAYVSGFAPPGITANFGVVGYFQDAASKWVASSWETSGRFVRAGIAGIAHYDLVSYIGETLRRLPDSPGWWWYEYEDGTMSPRQVYEKGGGLFVMSGGDVSRCTGRWGNKIEPSGFEPAEPATGTAQGTDARTEAKS